VSVPDPPVRFTTRSVLPVSSVIRGVPDTVTVSEKTTWMLIVEPTPYVSATAVDVTLTTLGAVESIVTDVPDTDEKLPAASTAYATYVPSINPVAANDVAVLAEAIDT
jgi:hypothetical protein